MKSKKKKVNVDRRAFLNALGASAGVAASLPAISILSGAAKGYAFDLEGTDSHQLKLRPAPAFASAQEAGEMAELYWMALLRDVNFAEYNWNRTAQLAAADLSKMSDFRGPKEGGEVTTKTLFRD